MREPHDHQTPTGSAGASDPPAGDAVGRVLSDRYRLERLIATGGMAAVWEARDELLARTVAVKVLHDHLAVDDEFRERFRREAVAAAKLTHPHIVGLYDSGSDGRAAWLVMEMIAGVTLRDEIRDGPALPAARVASIGEHVARALGYAHDRGLVHRDVKPANVLLGEDGTVKIADFGIAKIAGGGDDLTGTGAVLGTAAYVAPEQILDEPLDGACDQYALGCVLYEALAGQRPFAGDTPVAIAAQRLRAAPRPLRELRSDLPEGLDAVIARAMALRRADRYPTTDDLADALAPFAHRSPVVPAPAATAPPEAATSGGQPPRVLPRRPRRVTRVLAPLAVVVLLVVLLGAGFLDGQDDPAGDDGAQGLVGPANMTLFDPGGTGSEGAAGLPALVDGDASTAWRSVGYDTPDFGGLKEGLGFWLDLGGPHEVDSVALRTATPGIAYEIRVADQPASTLDAWEHVGTQGDAGELSEVVLDEPVVTRYLLVWVTGGLQPDGSGRFRAEASELAVRGRDA